MKISKALNFFCVALLLTLVFATVYCAVQQSYRTSANDPQIAIATELNTGLIKGKNINRFFTDTIDVENSLMPFITIYDKYFSVVNASGKLDGEPLKIPIGVFNDIKNGDLKCITTQPKKNVRLAMAILHTNHDEYIAVGRSLIEVEKRERSLIQIIVTGWIICISILFLQYLLNMNRKDF